jgi:hypothetical protein
LKFARILNKYRLVFWIILVVLTITVLLSPTHFTSEQHPIESIYVFGNLPLFAILYCVWLAVLLLLLFSHGERESDWEKLALVLIFAAVFVGFWLFNSPNAGFRGEAPATAGLVKHMIQENISTLPSDPVYNGFNNVPGTTLLALSFCKITGLSIATTFTLLLIFHLFTLTILLYVFFRANFKNSYIAAFGTLLVIQGNQMMGWYNYHPMIFGLIFVVMLLIILAKKEALSNSATLGFLAIMVLITATISHFMTSMMLFFTLLGIYVVQIRAKKSKDLKFLIIFLVIPIAWLIYNCTFLFRTLVPAIPQFIDKISNKDLFGLFGNITNIAVTYTGPQMPLWATLTHYFWWISIYIIGSLIAIWNFLRAKNLNGRGVIQTGGVLGLIMLTAVAILLSPGGSQFFRFILWGAFFAVPVTLTFFLKSTRRIKRAISVVAVILFLMLSFPTFLAHNNHANSTNTYPIELAATGFLGQNYPSGNGLTVFEIPAWKAPLLYDVPQADIRIIPESVRIRDKADAWDNINNLVASFENSHGQSAESQLLCFFEERAKGDFSFFWGVQPTDPEWNILKERLSSTNKIYSNGQVIMYSP